MIQLNETLLIVILTFCVATLFNALIARTTHSAMMQHDPNVFAKAMLHCNRLDTIRNLVIGEQISFQHL